MISRLKNISISSFVIEFNEHSQTFNKSKTKCFLISLESLNDSKTITNVFANKTFRRRLISNDIIVYALFVSISYTFNASIESRYDDREFKNLLIDHDAANRSSEDIEQYTILKRMISIELNENDVSKFKFNIDNNFSIDLINLNTSIDRIKFHIVFVHISFLLCLADLDRLDVYFNNLINMLIENSFRKDIDLQIDVTDPCQPRDMTKRGPLSEGGY